MKEIKTVLLFDMEHSYDSNWAYSEIFTTYDYEFYTKSQSSCSFNEESHFMDVDECKDFDIKKEFIRILQMVYENDDIDPETITKISNSFKISGNTLMMDINIVYTYNDQTTTAFISIPLDNPKIQEDKKLMEVFQKVADSKEGGITIYGEDSTVKIKRST